jgi:hypothetical protein
MQAAQGNARLPSRNGIAEAKSGVITRKRVIQYSRGSDD